MKHYLVAVVELQTILELLTMKSNRGKTFYSSLLQITEK
jgi:hypothetical protein